MSLEKKALSTLKSECGFRKGSSVLVACSGGPDSVALLALLNNHRNKLEIPRLGVYHLNHSLRGSESDQDEEFVSALARRWNLPFHSEKADVEVVSRSEGISFEMAGRKLRYSGLERLLESERYDLAALGHTASDNVEWLLLSLVRGRAEPMLWGIPARRGAFIRPLIRCTREEVIVYLKKERLTFREDSSNLDESYDRNHVRRRVIPELKALNPSLEDTISRTLELGDRIAESVRASSEKAYEDVIVRGSKGLELDTSKLSQYNITTQLRVLRRFVPWLGGRDLRRLVPLETSKGTREIQRGNSERLLWSYDRLRLEPLQERPGWKPFKLHSGESVCIEELGWRLSLRTLEGGRISYGSDEITLDVGLAKPPYVVRAWREGDRIVPFGHSRPRKIKKVFTDAKVPRGMRRLWPLVCAGEEDEDVLWIVGLMRSAAAPVTAGTRDTNIITLLRGENGE